MTLGTLTKAELFDKVVADAAFALPEGGVSQPVQGRFGTVLLRVTKIEPGTVKPFAEVEGEIRKGLALSRARDAMETTRDAIEDQRASAKPLADIAAELRRLADGARNGGLTIDDQAAPATIAVSNTGSYGSEAGTPILSPGTSVTLAIGATKRLA